MVEESMQDFMATETVLVNKNVESSHLKQSCPIQSPLLPNISTIPEIAPVAEDQVFKHMNL